jgi:hypothetical protein
MHFGPYTATGITFGFDFHHVAEIEVSPLTTYDDPHNSFSTRHICLRDVEGNDVLLTCYNPSEIKLTAQDSEPEAAILLQIQGLLDGHIWTPDTLEQIAHILNSNGWPVHDPEEVNL